MDAMMIVAALVSLLALGLLAWRIRRSRSDQRLQWQGTRSRDWTTEQLVELRATDLATDALT